MQGVAMKNFVCFALNLVVISMFPIVLGPAGLYNNSKAFWGWRLSP